MANNKRDYYEVLNLARDASPEDVKKAYRRHAHKHHPDRNHADPEAENRFKEGAEAYEVLSDPNKRQRYDQFGHAGLNGAGVRDYSHMNVGDIFSVFNDIFGETFGGGRRASRGGIDIQTEVQLTLTEIAEGAERTLEFMRNDLCDGCAGSGAAPGTNRKACKTCSGYGQVEQTTGLGSIFGRVVTTCPSCRGRGSSIETPCPACRASGRQARKHTVTVQIPPGVQEGQAVRVRGEGEPGETDNRRGDLHCFVRVMQHPFLERHENDVVCVMPISFTQAALGATVETPTLKGKTELKIPPGTQHGQLFRLKGLGIPSLRTGRRGDEVVQVLIEIPKRLDKTQEKLLRDFAKTEDKAVLPESRGFFERLREYLGG